MTNIKYIILLLCMCLSNELFAQVRLTLENCRTMALENNKRIAIAERDKERAELISNATYTHFLPRLSAEVLAGYTQDDSKMSIDIAGMPVDFDMDFNHFYMGELSVEQPIYMGGKIQSGYKMSRIGSDIAGLNRTLTENEVIVETDKAYWVSVQARELHLSAIAYKETVEAFYRVIKDACEVGMKWQNDLMKAQVQLNRVNLRLQRAKNSVRISNMNLCDIIGLELNSEIALSETFSGNSITLSSEATIYSRPEYAILEKQIQLKGYEKQHVQSDFLPKIGFVGSYGYIGGPRFNGMQIFGNRPSFSAMLSVSIPIFHWGEGRKKVRAAEKDIQIAELQRDDMKRKMSLELQQAINSYNEAVLEVQLTKEALSQSEENLRVSRDNYNLGMETIADYLDAQTIWRNSQTEYITAQTKLEISKTEYLKAKGILR